MAPYNYSNYYDPVGSQSNNQPQGYTYRTNNSSQYPNQANSNYQTNYNQTYDNNNNNYANQQYSANTQQGTAAATSTNRNASTLDSLTNPTYSQQNSTGNSNRTSGNNVASSYDNNTYYASAGFAALNDRSQSNNSPLYATNTGASTFGRLSLPDQSQSSTTFSNNQPYQTTSSNASTQYRNAPSSASSRSYKNAYNQAQNQTQPPQRYASPLHAVQAQQQHHGHNKQPSRSSNPQPSPQMSVQNVQQQQYQRQTSASVEPSPTTVDPTQVYDFRAEQQRKAQAEAEKRRKREAERAARKAEEDARRQEEERRIAEEAAKEEEQERLERESREAEEKAKKAEEEAANKKAAQARKNEQRRKAREEKRQSQTAATALTQMASGSAADAAIAGMPGVGDMSGPPANDEEADMRAMFKKMREFNARNPDMLAKLWEEERQTHAATQGSPAQQSPAQPTPKPAQPAAAAKKQPAAKTTPAQQSQPGRPPKSAAAQPATQTPAQKSATPAQAGGALWPPDKKGNLAEAAAKWLNNLPQNRSLGRSVSREQVLKILDGNPAYVQLCESLEAIGIRFGRSDLAQELLKAVPEVRQQKQVPSTINGQATAAAAAPNQPPGETQKKKGGRPKKDQPGNYSLGKPSQGNGSVSYQAPVFSLTNAAREVNKMDTTGATLGAQSSLASAIASAQGPSDLQSPYFTDHHMVDDDVQPVEVKDEEKPEEPPKPPADKEEAARKRTFNDLVDLTKDNDDSDDEGPPRKIQQPLAGPSNGVVKHQAQPNGFNKPMTFQQFLNRTQPVPNPTPYQDPCGPHMQQTQPRPMPPTVLPSNKPRPSGPTEEQKQHERMKGKILVEPIMRDRVARKSKYDSRTIARDVLLATGRHPDMRPLNAHLSTMQRLLADHGGAIDGTGNKSDLSTIKWDIIDPGEPAEDAKAKAKSAAERREKAIAGAGDVEGEADDEGEGLQSRAQDALRKIRNGEDLREEDLSNIEDPMVRKQIKNRLKVRKQSEKFRESGGEVTQDKDGNYVSVQQQIREGANPKRARGRPPKSATNSARASPAVNNPDITNNNDILGSDLTPNKGKKARVSVSKSSPSMASGSPAVGYAAFRQVDENGNVIKKKGRPVGWRKNIHSREANGLEAAKSASGHKPSGSRLRKSTGATPIMETSVQPVYQVYKCQWRNCTAQLDNLERLKKHVVKLHGTQTEDNHFECQWQPCQSQGKRLDTNGMLQGENATFDDIADWLKHVTKQHLDEVAWKLGDGPRGGSVSELPSDSEAWLSDANGRSVTPLIVPMSERQTEEPQSKVKKFPGFSSDGPMTKEQREAAAELQKLRDQKLREGVIMGREGSRLANDKRRRGFLDDEDFEDVIYDSD
ncbi:hypothetical protein M409DRAFT_68986 [Zasmidium cellare ATCC 36951]|uniref:C2H2-type domain-containing protein n=1 Tax=Zasmidium cellare ATCC 36951 TaxID=1080233 RepID=A0A6A6C6Q4_ZASCE|nr:uncharacterized protein M409DRAFT_68986 [Zasmidium cellare ATCC 36951]KAF2162715.1 hypothetical protein M409DRAFT_68986 [Zasmidium cellare ATCC 36951]